MRTIDLAGDIVFSRAKELKTTLFGALAEGGAVRLELTGVTRIDAAGVQLLVAARRAAARRGVEWSVGEAGAVVREAVGLLRLDEAVGLRPEAQA